MTEKAEEPKEAEKPAEKPKDGAEEKTEEKPKKARKLRPKFNSEVLKTHDKGLETLLAKFNRLDESKMTDDSEYITMVMRIYQMWMYHVFSADFNDMCWKIGDQNGVPAIVNEFTAGKRGVDRLIKDEAKTNNQNPNQPAAATPTSAAETALPAANSNQEAEKPVQSPPREGQEEKLPDILELV